MQEMHKFVSWNFRLLLFSTKFEKKNFNVAIKFLCTFEVVFAFVKKQSMHKMGNSWVKIIVK